jgi:membrane-associated phospholipid phosphatase
VHVTPPVFALVALLLSANALAATPQTPSSSQRRLWRAEWPTFSGYEAAGMLSAAGGTLALALMSPPSEPRWTGGVLFDEPVRDALRLSSPGARQTARRVGDYPYWFAAALPLIADPLVALSVDGDSRAASNIALIGLEAFSYAGLSSFISTRISVRERPDTTECRQQGAPDCEFDTEAFWSGHTSIVAASAGLVCAHHRFMPLWGGGLADVGACALASSGALVTAGSRLLADRHYATDVIVGLGVGFGIGYGVPVLLHYRYDELPAVAFDVRPLDGGGATLRIAGRF